MTNKNKEDVAKLKAQNQEAIDLYRDCGVNVYYQPARGNRKWFLDLMVENHVPSIHTFVPVAGAVSVLMVND